MASMRDTLTDMLTPVVEALGCELWGLEYISQARSATLRVYIDKDSGIEVTDCEKVSRQISSVLDVEDPINSKYTLEVSSPGMDRQLFTLVQYQRFIGETVSIRLSRQFEERKKLTGQLVGVEGDEVVIREGEDEYLLPIELIEKAQIVPSF